MRQVRPGDLVRLNREKFFRSDRREVGLAIFQQVELDTFFPKNVVGLVLHRNEFAMCQIYWLDDSIRSCDPYSGLGSALTWLAYAWRVRPRNGKHFIEHNMLEVIE